MFPRAPSRCIFITSIGSLRSITGPCSRRSQYRSDNGTSTGCALLPLSEEDATTSDRLGSFHCGGAATSYLFRSTEPVGPLYKSTTSLHYRDASGAVDNCSSQGAIPERPLMCWTAFLRATRSFVGGR